MEVGDKVLNYKKFYCMILLSLMLLSFATCFSFSSGEATKKVPTGWIDPNHEVVDNNDGSFTMNSYLTPQVDEAGKKCDANTYTLPSSDYWAKISSGYVASYATAHSTGVTVDKGSTNSLGPYMWVGQAKTSTPTYRCTRLFFEYDTSSIPDGATITGADFIYGQYFSITSPPDWNLTVTKWTGSRPFTTDDFTQYDGVQYATLNSAYFNKESQYQSSVIRWYNLPFTNTSLISKTGATMLCLMSQSDINNVPPTANVEELSLSLAQSSCALSVRFTVAEGDNQHFVDNDSSDVDSSPDLGTDFNFNMLRASDSFVNNYTEVNTGLSNTTAFTDGFEDDTFTKWTDGGATAWTITSTGVYAGTKAAYAGTRTTDGYLTTDNIDTSAFSYFYVEYWMYQVGVDYGDFTRILYDPVGGYGTAASISQSALDASNGAWSKSTWNITTANYRTSTFRWRFDLNLGTGETLTIDDFKVIGVTNNALYKLDVEVQFTGVNYTGFDNKELCIKTADLPVGEGLVVDYWNGSAWNFAMNLTANQWHNVSATSFLTASTLTLRISDRFQVSDATASKFPLDTIMLRFWNHIITASADAHSTISPSGTIYKNDGDSQTFSYSASTGYHLASVLVDGVDVLGTNPSSYTFTSISADHTIVVTSAIDTYNIVATVDAYSTINPSGTVTKDYGTSQTFTYSGITDYHVVSVLVDGVEVFGTNPSSYTFTSIAANHTIAVTSAINQVRYIVTTDAHSLTDPSAGTYYFNVGTNQTVWWWAEAGYHLTSVLVDGEEKLAQYPIGITFLNTHNNHNFTVTSAINTYDLTATADDHSTIDPSGTVTKDHGTSQTFTYSASTGYHLTSVLVDGVDVLGANPSSYTFTSINASHMITITSAINTYDLTVITDGFSTVDPTGNLTVNYGSDQTFTYSAVEGYRLISVLVDGLEVIETNATSYTFTAIADNHTIIILTEIGGTPTPTPTPPPTETPTPTPIGTMDGSIALASLVIIGAIAAPICFLLVYSEKKKKRASQAF